MTPPIEEYALIGDCQTAALVSLRGSVDWLCFPRFDSEACFAALLGTPDHGRWLLTPCENIVSISRRYRGDTLVLETEFRTESGVAAIIDYMPLRSGALDLVRIVEGRSGDVKMKMDLTLRFQYGLVVPWVRHIENGIRAVAGPDTVYCTAPVPMQGENLHTKAEFTVREGQRVPFELTWCNTYGEPPKSRDLEVMLADTESWWSEWSARCTYSGKWWEAVLRSLITLKALTYAPTGAIVAAPTTSLPEEIKGVRNWDYRFCWIRDATFTLYALIEGGYHDEAEAWREWLINSVAGLPQQLQLMYGVGGERFALERELDWLPGYECSAPVRIGNAAFSQFQLDIFGEVMDAMFHSRRAGLMLDENSWRVQRHLLHFLEDNWNRPDNGLWEMRGPQRNFTHSKMMAWVALDRGIKSILYYKLPGDEKRWTQLRDKIHTEVCDRGFSQKLNSFVQYYGSNEPDASLLMMPLVGFLPAEDPRVKGTVRFVERELAADGLVKRYNTSPEIDGLPPNEGAFLICSFWLVDNLVLQGRIDEAIERFEYLLSLRNDVGLLAEQYDPKAKRFLGNFPQAFSHVGIINSARNISRSGGPAEDRPS
ncbi:MAG: glycoside hydrolase family 15 protein [Deltaproteobacteria bacterium]|nr:glycoside hydrolase family 15 protein [Deltaproteobacteria bacterium]